MDIYRERGAISVYIRMKDHPYPQEYKPDVWYVKIVVIDAVEITVWDCRQWRGVDVVRIM